MNINTDLLQHVKRINNHVQAFPDNETGNTQLLMTMYNYMDSFKQVMDAATRVQMDFLTLQYDGFYRFAKLLEQMAQEIADGTITTP
ncbi:hypothetical protein MNBD_GAMMA08-1113 [hydrothermal vent metagenome]|uniref:Arylsulfatase regulatory protein n=1 Tax=hydrothermal vent metagenome TaxID=652676 RepID=A0A3B0WRZ9_9ZZZZ